MAVVLEQSQSAVVKPPHEGEQRAEKLQYHGEKLIRGLEARVRDVEKALVGQRTLNHEQAMTHEQQLFQATRAKEQAQRETDLVRGQLQELQAQLRQLQESQRQDQGLITAQRVEIAALQDQVHELRNQLDVSTQRVQALQAQIQNLVKQNNQILRHLEKMSSRSGSESEVTGLFLNLFSGAMSLFDPSIDTKNRLQRD